MNPALRNRTAIIGVGYTAMARHPDQSPARFAAEAALGAIADAGLTPQDIDGYVGSPGVGGANFSSSFVPKTVASLAPTWVLDVDGGPTVSVAAAVQALCAGACNYALVLLVTSDSPGIRRSGQGPVFAADAEQFSLPYGLGAGGGQFAFGLQRYMHEYGATREELYTVVRSARRHAHLNPYAYWRGKDLTLEDYLSSRWIYEPLCIYDCEIPLTTAGAVVLTTADRAGAAPHGAAYISGLASTNEPGDAIFRASGVDRDSMRAIQVYDGYSPFVWGWLERLGFCEPGEAASFCLNGRIEPGGQLPVNTSGGSLGEGRLVGLGQIREAAMQVMGRCGDRQVPGVEHCLTTAGQPNPDFTRYVIMFGAA